MTKREAQKERGWQNQSSLSEQPTRSSNRISSMLCIFEFRVSLLAFLSQSLFLSLATSVTQRDVNRRNSNQFKQTQFIELNFLSVDFHLSCCLIFFWVNSLCRSCLLLVFLIPLFMFSRFFNCSFFCLSVNSFYYRLTHRVNHRKEHFNEMSVFCCLSVWCCCLFYSFMFFHCWLTSVLQLDPNDIMFSFLTTCVFNLCFCNSEAGESRVKAKWVITGTRNELCIIIIAMTIAIVNCRWKFFPQKREGDRRLNDFNGLMII